MSLPFERSISRPATAGAPGLRRAALELLDVAEAERLQVRQVEPADGARDVPERVRALVAELGGVRQRAGADGVEHDHAGSGHRAILGRGGHVPRTARAVVFIVAVIALAAGVDRRSCDLPDARPRRPDATAQA